MAILETKTIQTHNDPSYINAVNQRYSMFFWNVQNVQVTHVKDSHMEFEDHVYDVEVRTVTETTQYATITYQRDKLIPRYDEIVAMEQEYCQLEEQISKAETTKKYALMSEPMPGLAWAGIIVGGLIFVNGYFLGLDGATISPFGAVALKLLGGLLFAGGLGFGIWTKNEDAKNGRQRYDAACAELEQSLFPKKSEMEAEIAALGRKILKEMRG